MLFEQPLKIDPIMPVISVRIPQLGEGLQEALLVEFLKKPGDQIARDEPIYVMETDKATTDVESPFAGTIVEWTVQPGTVLAIGSEIGKMEVAEGVREMPAGHSRASSEAQASSDTSPIGIPNPPGESSPLISAFQASDPLSVREDVIIPPRTRKYLKDLGLLDQAYQIPVRGSKMMPEDVDAFVTSAANQEVSASPASPEVSRHAEQKGRELRQHSSEERHTLVSLPKSQITLNYRMARGAGVCIPVTVVTDIDWTTIEVLRSKPSESSHHDGQDSTGSPSGFAIACWAVVQAMKKHDKFRSLLTSDGPSLKVFSHVNLGIAVALPGDEMLTAVVRRADQMTAQDFFPAYAAQVAAARQGQDQADETTTLTVSNIGKAGMRIGIPAIVAPAVATLALGEVFQWPIPDGESFRFRPTVTATLSFDHRIVNGVGAANFLNDVRKNIESMTDTCLAPELQ